MFFEPWLPIDVEPNWEVNGVSRGGNVAIGSYWIIIAGKVTYSKYFSWELGSSNKDVEKDDSLSDECLDMLSPNADNVGIGVIGILDFPTLLETSLSGSERAWAIYCEVFGLVWGLLEARVISLIQNSQLFPPH